MSRFVDKIAVESEPGLSGKQLLLTNEDLKPVEPARREWRGRNFGKERCRVFLQLIICLLTRSSGFLDRGFFQHQHMDDLVSINHRPRSLLVAVVALRLDRLLHRRRLHRLDGPHRREVSHFFPRRWTSIFRYLGISLACFEPHGNGLRLVRRSSMDRRRVRFPHDQSNLAIVGQLH